MKMDRSLIRIPVAVLLSGVFPLLALGEDGISAFEQMQSCKQDSDCVPAPEVYSACFHYCKGKECDYGKECPVFNRYFKNFPNCAANMPCHPLRGKPVCKKGKCEVE